MAGRQPEDDNPFLPRGAHTPSQSSAPVGLPPSAWPPSPFGDTQPRGSALLAETRQEETAPPPPAPTVQPPPAAKPRIAGLSERELYARSLSLDAREARVAAREAEVRQGMRLIRPHNWPRCFPILYHNISEEIQMGNQRMVSKGYHAWCIAAAAYAFNLLVLTVSLLGGGAATTVGSWFMALIVAGAGIPFSWMFWYRGLYTAAQTDNSLFAYSRFFLHMSIHLLWCLWMLLALPRVGRFSAGLFRVLDYFSATSGAHLRLNRALGVLSLINMALWATTLLLSSHTLKLAVDRFRSAGGTAELRRQARERAAAAAAETAASAI